MEGSFHSCSLNSQTLCWNTKNINKEINSTIHLVVCTEYDHHDRFMRHNTACVKIFRLKMCNKYSKQTIPSGRRYPLR